MLVNNFLTGVNKKAPQYMLFADGSAWRQNFIERREGERRLRISEADV